MISSAVLVYEWENCGSRLWITKLDLLVDFTQLFGDRDIVIEDSQS
jgi:hypothetical protein